MIRAKYIGRNNSCGFVLNRIYVLNERISSDGYIVLSDSKGYAMCPYDSIQAVVNNWNIIEVFKN